METVRSLCLMQLELPEVPPAHQAAHPKCPQSARHTLHHVLTRSSSEHGYRSHHRDSSRYKSLALTRSQTSSAVQRQARSRADKYSTLRICLARAKSRIRLKLRKISGCASLSRHLLQCRVPHLRVIQDWCALWWCRGCSTRTSASKLRGTGH